MSEAGIFVDRIGGWDTIWLDHLSFYRNAVGVKQRASQYQFNEMPEQAYMDGVTFFHSQFVENGKALDLIAERVNVQMSWINCLFKDNDQVAELQNSYGPMFINSDFVNNGGRPAIVDRTSAWGSPWVEFVNAYFRA